VLPQNLHIDLNIQFLPEMIDLHKRGKFPVDRLVSIYSIKDLDQALEDMESGKVSLEDSSVKEHLLTTRRI
jgi:D-arabinose 1-dehydrogenase-like Zn-dependent alcohol dehydrogenase